jgi:hypothetical protein
VDQHLCRHDEADLLNLAEPLAMRVQFRGIGAIYIGDIGKGSSYSRIQLISAPVLKVIANRGYLPTNTC